VNVELAAVVPAAAVNVMFTPCQFELVKVTEVGACVIAVLPVRVMGTLTELLGAALRRSDAVPVPPLFTDNVLGTKLITGVDVPMENATVATVLNTGEPASNAVAVAVWLPALRPVAVKLYGDEVSVFTRVPFTRNSTRCTLTLSVAVAARLTLVVPAGKAWPAVGAVKFTTGAVLPPPPWITNDLEAAVLRTGLPAS
jgi:hypothetical protein